MTIRTKAKILGISASYLSMMINGNRPWNSELKERFYELVNISVNSKNRVGEKEWCPGRDSNPHSLTEKRILSPPRLPFRHLGISNSYCSRQRKHYNWSRVINARLI